MGIINHIKEYSENRREDSITQGLTSGGHQLNGRWQLQLTSLDFDLKKYVNISLSYFFLNRLTKTHLTTLSLLPILLPFTLTLSHESNQY